MSSQHHDHDHRDDEFHYALKSNATWANYKQHSSPEYFQKFTQGQAPTILWLGCSDSRVPETTLLGLQPGEVFVHRNIANIITTSDLNVLAVIEYAVVHLKVAHIVLCGHTSCGGAAAALKDGRVGGVLDAWLTPLKVVRRDNVKELDAIENEAERAIRLAELNVEEGVKNLMANAVVEEAIRERNMKVHGTIYDISCGLLRELGIGTDQPLLKGAVSNELRGSLVQRQKEKLEPDVETISGKHGRLVFKDDGAEMEAV